MNCRLSRDGIAGCIDWWLRPFGRLALAANRITRPSAIIDGRRVKHRDACSLVVGRRLHANAGGVSLVIGFRAGWRRSHYSARSHTRLESLDELKVLRRDSETGGWFACLSFGCLGQSDRLQNEVTYGQTRPLDGGSRARTRLQRLDGAIDGVAACARRAGESGAGDRIEKSLRLLPLGVICLGQAKIDRSRQRFARSG